MRATVLPFAGLEAGDLVGDLAGDEARFAVFFGAAPAFAALVLAVLVLAVLVLAVFFVCPWRDAAICPFSVPVAPHPTV